MDDPEETSKQRQRTRLWLLALLAVVIIAVAVTVLTVFVVLSQQKTTTRISSTTSITMTTKVTSTETTTKTTTDHTITYANGLSYNQPKFCPNATWNPNAITFADRSTVGINPYGIFVNTNNMVYVASPFFDLVLIWPEGSTTPITANFIGLFSSFSIFVTITGDIYVDNGYNGQVEKLALNAAQSVTVMYVNGPCAGLFVDINDNLYCSMFDYHQVIKKSLNSITNTTTIVAGNGSSGSSPNMLDWPQGIFVDINFDLYVADCRNDRIQLFKSGQLNGITVAGDDLSITLNHPTGVVLDADHYLFIVDSNNHRIIGSGPYGFRCLVGCSNTLGSTSSQLYNPFSLSFDSFGNMFVTDSGNDRIQKFLLSTNSCSK